MFYSIRGGIGKFTEEEIVLSKVLNIWFSMMTYIFKETCNFWFSLEGRTYLNKPAAFDGHQALKG